MKLSFSRKSDKMNPSINCLGGTKMAICYDRLFHLMIDKKMSNAQLKEKAGFSTNIITRLKRNEYVSIESIERICRVLECGVDDILEFVPGEKEGKEA
jgi:putative transcriptional regulator